MMARSGSQPPSSKRAATAEVSEPKPEQRQLHAAFEMQGTPPQGRTEEGLPTPARGVRQPLKNFCLPVQQ